MNKTEYYCQKKSYPEKLQDSKPKSAKKILDSTKVKKIRPRITVENNDDQVKVRIQLDHDKIITKTTGGKL